MRSPEKIRRDVLFAETFPGWCASGGMYRLYNLEERTLKDEEMILNLEETVFQLEEMILNLEETVFQLGGMILNLEGTVLQLEGTILNLEETVLQLEGTILNLEGTVLQLEGMILKDDPHEHRSQTIVGSDQGSELRIGCFELRSRRF